jgi:MGT family glycosyltransferase
MQNGLESVFSTIAEGVGERPGVQLILSIGPALDPQQIKSLPKSAIVVINAPQIKLLERAALCITHAGLNTTLECLTQGVPMVAVPITNDQPGVAARIAYTKTGTIVPFQELAASAIRGRTDEVLRNPEYLQNAMRFKRIIAETDGLAGAAQLLENAFDLKPKDLSDVPQYSV